MVQKSVFFIVGVLILSGLHAQNTGQQPGVDYRDGNFSLASKIYGNASVQVNYEVPFDKTTGKPLKTASTILFMAPYINDFGLPWEKLSWTPFARKMGWSSYSLVIRTDPKDVRTPGKCYYYPAESGSGEVVIEAYKKLQKDFNLGSKNTAIP